MAEKELKKMPVNYPMGIKVNEEDLNDILTLDKIVELTKCYHGDKYVIGKDTSYCEKPHYHIHWHSVKESSLGAIKTFRTTKFKPLGVNKSFRFYYGQDLPSADPLLWLGYALKETQIKVSGLSITDDILAHAKSQLQIKQMKQVHSEKKKVVEKEKKDYKDLLFERVHTYYMHPDNTKYLNDEIQLYPRNIRPVIIRMLKEDGKFGSMKKHFLDSYYLEYMVRYHNWNEEQIDKFIYQY